MRIVKLVAENVKKLKAIDITPDSHMVRVTGANESGKSSVLDSVFMALGGKDAIPPMPIRGGAETAIIKLDLGEIRVERRFTENGTYLDVTTTDGAKYPSPQKLLDALFSELTFDPLEFARAKPKEQYETLRALVKVDIDLDEIDRHNALDYQNRTGWNARAKSTDERLSTLRGQVDATIPLELIDTAELETRIATASEHNRKIDARIAWRESLVVNRGQYAAKVAEIDDAVAQLEYQISSLLNDRDVATADIHACDVATTTDATTPIADRVDAAVVLEELKAAQRENARRSVAANLLGQIALVEADHAACVTAADALTGVMKARDETKKAAIAAAPLPIAGLGFGEGFVTLDGFPLSQSSSAQRLKVSAALAMAINPKLRIIRISDGSLLDDESLAMLREMAEANDYQCWIEEVDKSGVVGIYMVDGEVRAIDGHPVERDSTKE